MTRQECFLGSSILESASKPVFICTCIISTSENFSDHQLFVKLCHAYMYIHKGIKMLFYIRVHQFKMRQAVKNPCWRYLKCGTVLFNRLSTGATNYDTMTSIQT